MRVAVWRVNMTYMSISLVGLSITPPLPVKHFVHPLTNIPTVNRNNQNYGRENSQMKKQI